MILRNISNRRDIFACYCCCIVLLSLAGGGCSTKGTYVSDSRNYARTLARELQTDLVLADLDSVNLTLRQANIEAARNDRQINTLLEKLRQAEIEAGGVSTHLWPRLNLGANAELPLADDENSDTKLTGGVYLQYDIRRALGVSHETILRSADVEKNRLQLELSLAMLQKKLKNHLNQLSLREFASERKLQALQTAQQAYELAQVYTAQKLLDATVLAQWKKRMANLRFELMAVRQQVAQEKFALAEMLGRNLSQEITIEDVDTGEPLDQPLLKEQITPSDIWEKHNQAKLLELELIAAEAGSQLIRLERLPQINAEIGLGDIPLDSDETSASSLLRLSMTMPIFDLGDHSRKLEKSQITRDRVRDSLKTNIVRLYQRFQLSRSAHQAALDKLAQTKQAFEEMVSVLAAKEVLIAETRANNLTLFADKIELFDMEVVLREAETSVRQAADEVRLAIGEDLADYPLDELLEAL